MVKESTLPQREKQLFHKLVKCYEQKQFKQGLKHAKSILTNPACKDHGETLSMKGLILSAMNKKEEALELAKQGLKNDFKSGTCWHVYGLILRAEKKYDDAIKAYSNALKWENGRNQLILKDLSHLQIQMRDLDGFKQSRLEMLSLRPTLRASWIGYAIANHLLEENNAAYSILQEFRKTNQKTEQRGKSLENDFEMSELILYQNRILMESNKNVEALANLNNSRDDIVDQVTTLESLVKLHMKTMNFKEAEKYLTELVHRNPEKRDYYFQLADCVGASCDQNRLLEFYQVMQKTFPRAKLPKTIPLEIFTGNIFEKTLRSYFLEALRKCLPNIHVTLKPIYSDPEKLALIQSVSGEILELLEKEDRILPDGPIESPGCLVWLYHFLGQHYDSVGEHTKALDYINRGLDHTPTLIELYVARGRIYKHAGNIKYATECLDEAQSLDTADRFLNCKCCRYLIRDGRMEQAEEMAKQFTRENITLQENLKEMQVLWFQAESAESYYRQGNYGSALRKCYEIENVFADITEDQFDFHQYCMRKMTLTKYVEMLRLEDRLREHRFLRRAAVVAVKIYLAISDGKWNSVTGQTEEGDSQMTEAEKRKLRNKAKKAALKNKKKAEDEKKKTKKNEPNKVDELDPDKLILEAQDNSLQKAKEWVHWLEQLSPNWLDGQLLSYEVAKRRGKALQQIRALKRAIKSAGVNHPKVHLIITDWLLTRDQIQIEDQDVKTVVDEQNKKINESLSDTCPSRNNQNFLRDNKSSFPHRLAGAQLELRMNGADRIEEIIHDGDSFRGDIEQYQDAIKFLEKAKIDSTRVKEAAKLQWPLAVAFGAATDCPPRVLKPLKHQSNENNSN